MLTNAQPCLFDTRHCTGSCTHMRPPQSVPIFVAGAIERLSNLRKSGTWFQDKVLRPALLCGTCSLGGWLQGCGGCVIAQGSALGLMLCCSCLKVLNFRAKDFIFQFFPLGSARYVALFTSLACFRFGSPKHFTLQVRRDKWHMLPTIHRGQSTKLLREGMPRNVHPSVCRNLCTNRDLKSHYKNQQFKSN